MRLSDPLSIRAMAHPLRLDLIELLGTLGPATAAECGRRLEQSQASCSFHLRQLAKYGFVVEAPASTDRRERRWQLTDVEQSWSSVDGGPAAEELERVFISREADRLLHWVDTGDREPEDWRRAATLGGATLPLTIAELTRVRNAIAAVIAPYVDRLGKPSSWPADARLVRILTAATPLPRNDTDPNREASSS